MQLASKSELADFALKRGLDASGTLEDIRRRVRDYFDRHPEEDTDIEPVAVAGTSTDTILDAREAPRTPLTLSIPVPPTRPPASPPGDDAKVINQMRKWGCHFDGRDPIAFLERIDELTTAYGFSGEQLLKGLPELLRGETLLWYRNARYDWTTWADFEKAFRSQFLPRRYQSAIQREIADRRQKTSEKFAKYATEILTLMRRAGNYSRDEQLDRVYENMHPEYKIYVRYDDATSLAELQARAAEFEDIEQQRQDLKKTDRATAPTTTVAKILLAMRERRRAHPPVSPASGKRRADRDHRGRRTKPGIRITFTPRPHLRVRIHQYQCHALLDTGSEISFINQATATYVQQRGYDIDKTESQVQLADGNPTPIPGTVTLPLQIGGRTYYHAFSILPSLESPVLIGADLWARTRIRIPPPPSGRTKSASPKCESTNDPTTGTLEEEQQLRKFLDGELPKFNEVAGPTDRTEHQIRLIDARPIKQRYRPRNPAMQAVIDREVEEMETAGVIEPSHSAWSSPVVVVKKKDGKFRFCIDFRKVNEVTEKDAYPLPQVTATLDKLRGARYLTTLDLKNGYLQVPLAPESRPITAFTIPGRGLFQFKVMPFGLHSAPATFQRLLDAVIGPALEPHVFVYLDDIIVISRTFDDHLRLLREVFQRLRAARLRLNPAKCHFCVNRLKYLGHVVDRNGIRTDPEKVSAVADWPKPASVKQVRQFLGMASWYRRFIANFSTLAAPLTRLTKKNARWAWGPDEDATFRTLKDALISAPVLACPDFSRRFFLQTDASTSGLGAVLTQYFEEGERVIAYASRTLNGAERNYSATELECLAVVWGIRRMKGYLEGYAFTVITDHQSLKWLQRLESPTGRLARWLFEIQQYDLDIKYRRGTLNRVADALSRQPEICAAKATPCRWYRRLHEAVTREPGSHPDFRLENGKLQKHILHSLNFKETPTDEQWKICIPKEQRPGLMQ
ncbi:reverse ribonuclease integrase, partial [Lasius niger]